MCKYVYAFVLVYVYVYADALKTKRAFCAFFVGVGWGAARGGVQRTCMGFGLERFLVKRFVLACHLFFRICGQRTQGTRF